MKGIEYAYLVKSEWNADGKTSRQQTIKYLGRSSGVELEDIPTQYRQDSKILSFLSKHSPLDLNKKKILIEDFSKKLYLLLASGDVDSATRIYEGSKNVLSLEEFYDKILRPVMYDVGMKWEKSEIDVATEHVCTNTAYGLVAAINERISKSDNREKILLCSPEGELHGLSASVIESVLESSGYRVFNATPSIPTDSIITFIRNTEPDLIMISITLPDNIKAGERLVKRIRSEFLIPILVGGLAISVRKGNFHGTVTSNPQENSIEDVLRLVRSSLRKERTIA
ncbi:MAG TPA: cobalamin B12-binding domain-containing protein [Nitrososphaeraceae archaeon]|nr:cobalamin B12-binding domain-containing protein [Nitrososphaeraceae archaeon]